MKQSETLVQIAKWYFLDGLSQADIARRIHKSRSMVSKMITEARNQKIVDIRISLPLSRNSELEQGLIQHCSLADARVVESLESADLNLTVLAKAGAECLAESLRENLTVGMAWSRTIREVVKQLEPMNLRDVTVVQLSGAASLDDPAANGSEIIQNFGEKIGASERYFPAPLVVRKPEVAESLLSEPVVRQSIELARSCDLAVVGIGAIDPTVNSLLQAKLIDRRTLDQFIREGSVGDILAHQLDRDGEMLNLDFNRRVIGMDIAALRNIPRVVAVAAGEKKVDAIRAAIAGCYVNVLVTDSATAELLLGRSPAGTDCPDRP
jgi:deoxyribonucleoside regulator